MDETTSADWNQLLEIAAPQDGLFTTRQAADRLAHPRSGHASRARRRRGRALALWRSGAMTQAYRAGAAFKRALEQRLRTASASGIDLARRRKLVVFECFLARVALELTTA